jgi:apolipoprotein N-acyltransferase
VSPRLLAFLSGVLLVLSFPKFGHSALAWIALSPLVLAVAIAVREHTSAVRIFWLGVVAGLTYFAGTLYWVVQVMQQYGGLATPVAALVGLLLWAYLAVYPGLFALLLRASILRFGVTGLWMAPLFWVATEYLRGWVGGGFPWVLLGSSQATVLPVAQAGAIAGVFGLSALVALVSTAAAVFSLTRAAAHRAGVAAVALVVIATAAAGVWRISRGALLAGGTPVRVGLVQGSVLQDQKWDPKFRDAIRNRYLELSRSVIGQGAELVLWPEASTPFYFDAEAPLAEPIRALARATRTPFIIGSDEYEPGGDQATDRYYNSALLIDESGRTQRSYRKMLLVPFGEYVPLKSVLFFVGPLVEAVSDFSAGTTPVVFDAGGRRLSVAICYESVYPSLAQQFVEEGSELLATITNDAWFGRSSAAYQHFQQGSLRAIEQARYLVRSANTGISGAVDPYGRVLATTPLFEPMAVAVDVRLLQYRTIYSRTGDLVAWVSLVASAVVAIIGLRRPR